MGHKYHLGQPGPAIGFLQEMVDWGITGSKIKDNGAMDGPGSIWMQDSVAPATTYEQRPGRWVGEPHWPFRIVEQRYPLGEYRIFDSEAARRVPKSPELTVQSPLSLGQWGSGARIMRHQICL